MGNDAQGDVINGTRVFVQKMVTEPDADQKHHVAIMVFGRTDATQVVQGFADSDTLLNAQLDALMTSTSLGTTNLYGAYERAINEVVAAGATLDLVERSVVILTDGTHEAGDEANMRTSIIGVCPCNSKSHVLK